MSYTYLWLCSCGQRENIVWEVWLHDNNGLGMGRCRSGAIFAFRLLFSSRKLRWCFQTATETRFGSIKGRPFQYKGFPSTFLGMYSSYKSLYDKGHQQKKSFLVSFCLHSHDGLKHQKTISRGCRGGPVIKGSCCFLQDRSSVPSTHRRWLTLAGHATADLCWCLHKPTHRHTFIHIILQRRNM